MKQWQHIIYWFAMLCVFIGLVAFEEAQEHKSPLSSIDINLIQPKNQHFLTREEILQIIDIKQDSLSKMSITAINTALLEDRLQNEVFIADAEVFSTLDGKLSVQVKQKEAIARVISSQVHHYLDANGAPFPTSKNYSAQVPVLTGKTDSTAIYEAIALLTSLNANTYFTNYLAEIHTDANGHIALIPVQGRHRVLLGAPTQIEQKLKKLEAFYQNVVTTENLGSFKLINVAYKNQVVSTKY